MSTIGYSPWLDAGRYGQELGNTLGQILLSIPQIRMQNARQQFEMDRQNTLDQQQYQLFPSQLQLAQGAVPAQDARAAQERAMAAYYTQQPGIEQAKIDATKDVTDSKNRMAILMHEAATKASIRLAQEKAKSQKARQLHFVPGTQYQDPGTFDPYSGQFSPMPQQAMPQTMAPPPVQDPRTIAGFLQHPMQNTATGLTDLFHMLSGGSQQQQMAPQGAPPLTATNPQTGQKVISYDGGQTWH